VLQLLELEVLHMPRLEVLRMTASGVHIPYIKVTSLSSLHQLHRCANLCRKQHSLGPEVFEVDGVGGVTGGDRQGSLWPSERFLVQDIANCAGRGHHEITYAPNLAGTKMTCWDAK
jgi:hypothetical protein